MSASQPLVDETRAERPPALAWLAVVAFTALVYENAADLEFLRYDDQSFVVENAMVREGLTWSGVRGAFTTQISGNWTPIALLSHELDVTLFGLEPAGHHAMNVMLHILASLAWLWAFSRAMSWPGALCVALVFALHPMHVESVAWIAERRDVLCGLFFAVAVGLWLRPEVRERVAGRLLVTAVGALAMGSKATAVTLPFVLLLLDAWPLRRVQLFRGEALPIKKLVERLVEKLPLFFCALAVSAATMVFQQPQELSHESSLFTRAVGALVAYAHYLRSFVWPSDMVVLTPRPAEWPATTVLVALVAVLAVCGAAAALVRRERRAARSGLHEDEHRAGGGGGGGGGGVVVGLLWFAGTLVPVIGLVQVGEQAYADRYTYLPYVGLTLALVSAVPIVSPRWAGPRLPVVVVVAWIAALGWRAHAQVDVWRDTRTLFEHALVHGAASARAHEVVGNDRAAHGDWLGALPHLREAARLRPTSSAAHAAHGHALLRTRSVDEARAAFATAIALDATNADAWFGQALALVDARDTTVQHDDVVQALRTAVSLDPGRAALRVELARALANSEPEGARAALAMVERTPAARASDLFDAGALFIALGDAPAALAMWRAGLERFPNAVEMRMAAVVLWCSEPATRDVAAAQASIVVLRELVGEEPAAQPMLATLDACARAPPPARDAEALTRILRAGSPRSFVGGSTSP